MSIVFYKSKEENAYTLSNLCSGQSGNFLVEKQVFIQEIGTYQGAVGQDRAVPSFADTAQGPGRPLLIAVIPFLFDFLAAVSAWVE